MYGFGGFGLPKGSLWESIFADFENSACKNDMLELRHENEAFLALIWRGRRQGGGLPESSDSAENGEWVQARPAPPAGVRRILRLRPCRRPLWQSQASWLLAWRLGNILIGSLACWVLLSVFCFASTVCWSVCWFSGCWMLVSMLFFWYLQLPRYSP